MNNTSSEYTNLKEKIKLYLDTLDTKEKITINIAIEILGDSFEIEKSIGFIKWNKNN